MKYFEQDQIDRYVDGPFTTSAYEGSRVLVCRIRMVMQQMCDQDAGVREVAVATIKSGRILSKANPASLSAVLQHVQHVYPATRQAALNALPFVCPEQNKSVISAIVVGLEDTDWAVRREAANCASLLGDRLDDRLMQVGAHDKCTPSGCESTEALGQHESLRGRGIDLETPCLAGAVVLLVDAETSSLSITCDPAQSKPYIPSTAGHASDLAAPKP